jgi:Flp pilus assembly CpaF family ATPase
MKGDEAADFSIACYTGSQCMTTVHSNSAAEAYDKVIGYALSAEPGRDVNYFAKQLQSLDTVVYIENYHIKEIMEQRGWNKTTEEYDLVPVYKEGQMLS